MSRELVLSLIVKFSPLILGWVAALFVARVEPKLHAWLDSLAAKNSALKSIAQVEHLAEVVAHKVWSDMQPKLTAASADGKITPEELATLRAAFVADLKAALGEEGKAALGVAVGLAEDYFNHYLTGLSAKFVPAPASAPTSPK